MPKEIKVPTLVGAKIVEVRDMNAEDAARSGVELNRMDTPMAVVLDNGVTLIPLADPEGNGTGCLTGLFKKTSFYLAAEKLA